MQGDIHNLGKDIVVFMLEVSGFQVIDLGVDVSPERFVQAIRTHQPSIVGLSALLTVAYDAMRRTVDAIREAGLYDCVKIMVGGGHTTDKVRASQAPTPSARMRWPRSGSLRAGQRGP